MVAELSHIVICRSRITPSVRELFVRAEDYRRDIRWSLRHIAEIYLMFNHRHFLQDPFHFIIHKQTLRWPPLWVSQSSFGPVLGRHWAAGSVVKWTTNRLLSTSGRVGFFEPHCYCSWNCTTPWSGTPWRIGNCYHCLVGLVVYSQVLCVCW